MIVPAWLHSIIMTEILTALREAPMKAFELYSRIKAKFADEQTPEIYNAIEIPLDGGGRHRRGGWLPAARFGRGGGLCLGLRCGHGGRGRCCRCRCWTVGI